MESSAVMTVLSVGVKTALTPAAMRPQRPSGLRRWWCRSSRCTGCPCCRRKLGVCNGLCRSILAQIIQQADGVDVGVDGQDEVHDGVGVQGVGSAGDVRLGVKACGSGVGDGGVDDGDVGILTAASMVAAVGVATATMTSTPSATRSARSGSGWSGRPAHWRSSRRSRR